MIRATTPTHKFNLPFDYAKNVVALRSTYSQDGNIVLEKTENDIEFNGNTVYYKLSQEETAKFDAGKYIEWQMKIKTINGTVIPSKIYYLDCKKILSDEVL